MRRAALADKGVEPSQREITLIPNHVAIIMDGNGRWASERGLPRLAGHRAGTGNIHRIVENFAAFRVKYLTLYAFSTENWNRPRTEVNGLLRILEGVIDKETKSLHEGGVRICHLGKLEGLSKSLQEKVHKATELTKNNERMTLSIAFNYGGRAELLDAIRQIVREGIPPENISETLFDRYLSTAGLPDPDLIIRTAGEMRLSNFLLWQSAYSEYYSTLAYWPDFDKEEIKKALLAYSQRQRRFGKLY